MAQQKKKKNASWGANQSKKQLKQNHQEIFFGVQQSQPCQNAQENQPFQTDSVSLFFFCDDIISSNHLTIQPVASKVNLHGICWIKKSHIKLVQLLLVLYMCFYQKLWNYLQVCREDPYCCSHKLSIQINVTFHSRSVEKLEQLAALAATTVEF